MVPLLWFVLEKRKAIEQQVYRALTMSRISLEECDLSIVGSWYINLGSIDFFFGLLLPQIRWYAYDFTSHAVRFVMMQWVPTSSTKSLKGLGRIMMCRLDSFSSHKRKQWMSLNIKTMRLQLLEDVQFKNEKRHTKLISLFLFFQ